MGVPKKKVKKKFASLFLCKSCRRILPIINQIYYCNSCHTDYLREISEQLQDLPPPLTLRRETSADYIH